MNGDSSNPAISKYSCAFSFNTVPANGLNHSLFLTLFTKSLPFGSVGLYKIDLLPKARGPASERPWNIVTILFSEINFATFSGLMSYTLNILL